MSWAKTALSATNIRRKLVASSKPDCLLAVAAASLAVAASATMMIVAHDESSEDNSENVDSINNNYDTNAHIDSLLETRDTTTPSRLTGVPVVLQHDPMFIPQAWNITKCEPMFSSWRMPRLSSHRTIQKIKETATRETLKSKYKVQWRDPLGQGSFGAVYLATDRVTGEKVAVKKIPKRFTDDISFQREMDALMTVRQQGGHPNICGLRENFDEGDFYFLVLDLISGGEMFDHLCAQGAYSEADAARLVREIASALAFLHGIGVVHGDLKPENLMLSSENPLLAVIKLVDFGCAQVTSPEGDTFCADGGSTTDGARDRRGKANTPAYTPPEALGKESKDKALSPSFDMWALGVILYIMLTGVHPFDLYGNASDAEIEDKILSGQNAPIRKSPLTAHLSADALDVIERLFQRKPGKRLSAFALLENPWVRGETARIKKIEDSDKRLSTYKAIKTKLGAMVFADLVSFSESPGSNEVARKTSLIERAFQNLDLNHRGYVTTEELHKLTQNGMADSKDMNEQISLSGFADLLADNMKNCYFPKGHVVYREGEVGNNMYFINSGSVEVYTRDGFSRVSRQSGDFFGEGALLHPKMIRSASIRCSTPVHAIEISREYFEKFLMDDAKTKLNLRERDKSRKRERAKKILRMQQSMQELSFKKGETIFEYGGPANALYLLEEGAVDISLGDHRVLSIEPGEMCGEHSLIFGRPRNVTATCVSDNCKVYALRSRDFYSLLDSHPSLKESVRDTCLRREFQKALCAITKNPFPKSERDLRAAFDIVDTNKTGKLDLPNVRRMLKRFDKNYTEADVKDILKSLDLDESGTISWEEFKKIFGMQG